MSLIITARLITRAYRSQALSFNFNAVNLKICQEKNFFEIAAPLIQKRGLWDKKETVAKPDDNLEKIYVGSLASKIKIVKLLSLTTSFLGLAVQPYLVPKLVETGTIVLPFAVSLGLCFFTFGTPILLHMITKKYVIDIDYNDRTKSYTATVFTIFARKKKIEFTPDDVEQPGLGQMLTNCIIHGQPLLLDFSNFKNPQHFAAIMGYDKPMNFKFEPDIVDKKVTDSKPHEYHPDRDQMKEKKSARN